MVHSSLPFSKVGELAEVNIAPYTVATGFWEKAALNGWWFGHAGGESYRIVSRRCSGILLCACCGLLGATVFLADTFPTVPTLKVEATRSMAKLATAMYLIFLWSLWSLTNRHEKKLGSGELRPSIRTHPQQWERSQIWNPPRSEAEPLSFFIRDFLRLHWCCLALFFFQKQVALSEIFFLEKFHQLSHWKKTGHEGLVGLLWRVFFNYPCLNGDYVKNQYEDSVIFNNRPICLMDFVSEFFLGGQKLSLTDSNSRATFWLDDVRLTIFLSPTLLILVRQAGVHGFWAGHIPGHGPWKRTWLAGEKQPWMKIEWNRKGVPSAWNHQKGCRTVL